MAALTVVTPATLARRLKEFWRSPVAWAHFQGLQLEPDAHGALLHSLRRFLATRSRLNVVHGHVGSLAAAWLKSGAGTSFWGADHYHLLLYGDPPCPPYFRTWSRHHIAIRRLVTELLIDSPLNFDHGADPAIPRQPKAPDRRPAEESSASMSSDWTNSAC